MSRVGSGGSGRSGRSKWLLGLALAAAGGWLLVQGLGPAAPYPPSTRIRGVDFDWSTHRSQAPGSGDWGITWAADGNQYTAWGNGGGFGGSDSDGRVFLGIARIEGGRRDYRGFNVWGGKNPESPASFSGKAYSLLALGDSIYLWRCGDSDGVSAYDFQQLYRSDDFARTWSFTGVEFTRDSFPEADDGFFCPVFLQFGQAYEGARDHFVYIYAPEIQSLEWPVIHRPGELALLRVPRDSLEEIDQYEYFAGPDAEGEPRWSRSPGDRRPAWQDPANGVMHPALHFNPGLKRYILTVEHSRRSKGNLAMYEAPEPWGPWRTVLLEDDFGGGRIPDNTYMWVIPTKWLSRDGRDFVMIFSGKERLDSWNTVEGHFTTD